MTLVACSVVAAHGDLPNTDMNREPCLTVLGETGTTTDIAVFYLGSHNDGFHPEAPMRLLQRNYRFDRAANTLTPLTEGVVIYEQDIWLSGFGHVQSPTAFVVPSGPYAGRVVMLFSQLDSVSGTFSDDNRSVYVMLNDNGGDPASWSTPELIFDANSLSKTYLITSPAGEVVILPPDHPVAPGRVVSVIYDSSSTCYTIYSDNFGGADGTDWTLGTPMEPSEAINETSICLGADGDIVFTHRLTASPTNRRNWSKSTDGGVTIVEQGFLSNWQGAGCSVGSEGMPDGRVCIARPLLAGAIVRAGTQIDFLNPATMESERTILPWSTGRYMGYSSVRHLFGGTYLAVGVEGGSVAYNVDNTCYLAILRL